MAGSNAARCCWLSHVAGSQTERRGRQEGSLSGTGIRPVVVRGHQQVPTHALPCMVAGRPFSLPAAVAGTAAAGTAVLSVAKGSSAAFATFWKVRFSLQPVLNQCQWADQDASCLDGQPTQSACRQCFTGSTVSAKKRTCTSAMQIVLRRLLQSTSTVTARPSQCFGKQR